MSAIRAAGRSQSCVLGKSGVRFARNASTPSRPVGARQGDLSEQSLGGHLRGPGAGQQLDDDPVGGSSSG